MNEHIQSKMADPTRDFHHPRYQEIPDVGLYLEQTAKYIDSYLSPLEDISITGSMSRRRSSTIPSKNNTAGIRLLP